MSTSYADLTGDYTADTAHSRIGFVARHVMISKVRGSFDEFEVAAHLDGENPSASSVRVTIQGKSIDTRNSQRDQHLRTNDFLDLDNHPELTFVSTSVTPQDGDRFLVAGDLTVRGVTKPVEIGFEFLGSHPGPDGKLRVGLEGSVEINRKDFGVNWNAALEGGGVMVGDKVTLEIEIEAVKND